MSVSSDDLSRRTENQAATLEETAAAMDELTASVRSAANGAREVEGVVGNARKDAEESEPVVKNAVAAMTEIESSSEEISQIIGVIDDIAFQTNLLALNAGVEAARAGEAGRGFAVVASEVRALAQRSSDAAKQIKTLISESSGQVERGVSLVGQAGDVLTKIAGHINHISGLVGEIASGAEEQSIGLGEINIGVTQLDKVTQQNAAMVEEATASSHALNGDATELSEVVSRFKLNEAERKAAARSNNVTSLGAKRAAREVDPKPALLRENVRAATAGGAAQAAVGGRDADVWQDF
jgi:methyl-accepting chemotaxis protein